MRQRTPKLTSDAAIIIAVACATFAVAQYFDLFERFTNFAHRHETWQVDELLVVGASLSATMLLLGWQQSRRLCVAVRRSTEARLDLEESLLRYRSLFDHNADAAFSIDPEGNTTSVNPACELVTGYTAAEMMQMSWTDIIVPEDLEEAATAFLAALGGQTQERTYSLIRKDGRRVLVTVTAVPIIVDDKVVGVYGLAKDVTERERLKVELSLLSSAVDAAAEAISIADSSGIVVYANKSRLGSRLPEDVIGRHWSTFFTPEEAEALAAQADQAMGETGHWHGMTLVSGPEGGPPTSHELSLTLLDDGHSLTIFRDVNEREVAQRALRQSEQHYRTILEQIAEGYFEVDLDGRFTFLNDSLCRLLGFTRDELLGVDLRAHADEENAAVITEHFRRVQATGVPDPGFVFWYRHSDGTPRAASSSATLIRGEDGGLVGFRGVMRDVTDRSRSEMALKHSEERYRLVTRATKEIMWDADLPAGTTTWTGALREMLGMDVDRIEFEDEWWQGHVHPEDWDRVVGSLDRTLGSRDTAWSGEYRLQRADGSYAVVFARGHVLRDESGAAVRLVGSMMDITERTQREEELRLARQDADEASQAKSLFLANMSHEIRTPMNGVIGMVDLLLETDLTPEQRGFAETVRQSGDRLLVIINDILDLSKVEAGKMRLETTDFSLGSLLESTVAPMASAAQRKGLAFTTTVSPELGDVFVGDPERIAQVLTNLLNNAVKFTERGSVSLSVEPLRTPGDGDTSMVRFVIEDTGIGLTEAQVERLFQPFSQADTSTTRRYGGTGLGLTISRQLVDLMQGRIRVRSRFGVGSTFAFELPLLPAEAGAPVVETAEVRSLHSADTGAHVLLVEDNDVNQEVAKLMLKRLGYGVDVARDGIEAMDALGRRSYSAVLMDIQMPNMDGYEATRRFREQERADLTGSGGRTPVIAMTANALEGDRQKSLNAGMDDYLAKPVRLDELEEVLRRWTAPAEQAGLSEQPEPWPVTGAESLEPGAIASLRTIGAGLPGDFLDVLVSTYLEDTEARLVELADAVERGDATSMSRIVHFLKSSSASMGALRMIELLGHVERLAAGADPGSSAEGLTEALSAELENVRAALDDELRHAAS